MRCPYGQPGDELWVRETFRGPYRDGYDYRATYSGPISVDPWRPSIHMPREASRITLRVTSVRVERLQEISGADAFAEGIERLEDHSWEATRARPLGTFKGLDEWSEEVPYWVEPVEAFCALWKHINGPGSWAENPWVWVVDFERVAP